MDQTQIDLNDAVKLIGNAIARLEVFKQVSYVLEFNRNNHIDEIIKELENGLDKILHKP
jgi:hypothetical protein